MKRNKPLISYAFLQKIEQTITTYQLLSPGMKILLAVSGGSDSMAMLDAFSRLQETLNIQLYVGHINHGFREALADEDEFFVADNAKKRNLPFLSLAFSQSEMAQCHKNNLEECARNLRYQKLVTLAQEANCQRIATAHTKSDQAETLLQRILRSSSITGLKGISPIRHDLSIPIIRPLIQHSHSEITYYSLENEITHRHDVMNDDETFTRVRIRNDLIPQLQDEYNPKLEEALNRLAQSANEDEEFWNAHIQSLLQQLNHATQKKPSRRRDYLHLTSAEGKRVTKAWLRFHQIDISWEHITMIDRLIRSSKPQSDYHLTHHLTFYRRYDSLFIASSKQKQSPPGEYEIQFQGETFLEAFGLVIATQVIDYDSTLDICAQSHLAYFDAEKVRRPLTARTRREGDTIIPLGMLGTKKVKKLFQEQRLSYEERQQKPIICFGDEIAWIPGCCQSERFRVDPSTRLLLVITFNKERCE